MASWLRDQHAAAQAARWQAASVAQINNRAHSQARAAVERTIAMLKQWRGLAGGYRGPLARFPVTLRTVVALEKFRIYETPF